MLAQISSNQSLLAGEILGLLRVFRCGSIATRSRLSAIASARPIVPTAIGDTNATVASSRPVVPPVNAQ